MIEMSQDDYYNTISPKTDFDRIAYLISYTRTVWCTCSIFASRFWAHL